MKNSYRLIYVDSEGIDILYKQLIKKTVGIGQRNKNNCHVLEQTSTAIEELERLLIYLKNTEDADLYTNLEDAVKYLLVNENNVAFIDTDAKFDIPQLCSGVDNKSIVREINDSNIILYCKTIQLQADWNANYCRRVTNSLIVMPSSTSKYVSLKQEILTDYYRGRDVPINVVGAIYNSWKYIEITPCVIRMAMH